MPDPVDLPRAVPVEDADLLTQSLNFAMDLDHWRRLSMLWHERLAQSGYDAVALDRAGTLKRSFEAIGQVIDSLDYSQSDDPVQQFLATSAGAATVINPVLQVVAINEAGRAIFGVEQGQVIKLHWIDPLFQSKVHQAIVNGHMGNGTVQAIRVVLPGQRNGLAEMFTIPGPGNTGNLIAIRTLEFAWDEANQQFLEEAFGLTQSEIEVSRLLFEGYRIDEIVEQRGVSKSTIRTQLHMIFQKTETANQVELILMLAKLANRTHTPAPSTTQHWSDPLGREKVLRRPDGYRLAHTWLGDPKGKVALYVHGGTHGYLFPEPFEQVLADNGVKLIVMSRPGFGASERNRDLDTMTDIENSLLFLCSALGLESPPVVAMHYAAIPVARLSASSQNPLGPVLAFADIMRYGKANSRNSTPQARVFDWLARFAPWVNETNFRAAYRHLQSKPAKDILKVLFANHVWDLASLDRPEMLVPLHNAINFITVEGYRSELEDESMRIVNIMSFIRMMDMPFHLAMGEIDSHYMDGRKELTYENELNQLVSEGILSSFQRIPKSAFFIPYQNPDFAAKIISDFVIGANYTK